MNLLDIFTIIAAIVCGIVLLVIIANSVFSKRKYEQVMLENRGLTSKVEELQKEKEKLIFHISILVSDESPVRSNIYDEWRLRLDINSSAFDKIGRMLNSKIIK